MNVIVMSGCSGSGKSTQAKEMGGSVCSADNYFLHDDGSYVFDIKKLSDAHGHCFKNFILLLQNKTPLVVVDNTNTSVEEISPYMLGANAFGYDSEIITINCSGVYLDKYITRNIHKVPASTIVAQAKRILERRLPPWWKSRIVSPTF